MARTLPRSANLAGWAARIKSAACSGVIKLLPSRFGLRRFGALGLAKEPEFLGTKKNHKSQGFLFAALFNQQANASLVTKPNNTKTMKKLLRFFSVSLLAITLSGFVPSTLQAGPDRSQQVFVPVKYLSSLENLKAGTKIAVTCPDCKMVVVKKVAKDKSNLNHFECPVCKHSFEVVQSPGGKTSIPKLLCRDSQGHTMALQVCAEMH